MPRFTFRVSGLEDNTASRRNFDRPYEEEFELAADDIGDALNELINGSGMWETLDFERGFTIAFVPKEDR